MTLKKLIITVSPHIHTHDYVCMYFIKYFGLKIVLTEINKKTKADF